MMIAMRFPRCKSENSCFNEIINHDLFENVWMFDFLLLYLYQEIIKTTDYGEKV